MLLTKTATRDARLIARNSVAHLVAAITLLADKLGARGTLIVVVAMVHGRVRARMNTCARLITGRLLGSTRQRRVEHLNSAVAVHLGPDHIGT